MSKIIVPITSRFDAPSSRLAQAAKSILNDAAIVALFVGGWLVLDGIVYAVPVEAALGAGITLLAGVLRAFAKAGR